MRAFLAKRNVTAKLMKMRSESSMFISFNSYLDFCSNKNFFSISIFTVVQKEENSLSKSASVDQTDDQAATTIQKGISENESESNE